MQVINFRRQWFLAFNFQWASESPEKHLKKSDAQALPTETESVVWGGAGAAPGYSIVQL